MHHTLRTAGSLSLALVATGLLGGSALAQGDDCSSGSPITGTGSWFWDNSTNTTSGFDGGDPFTCFSPANAGVTGTDTIRQDLFYVWTVPAGGGNFVFDTENSSINTDTKMSIHAGSDCNAVCVAADDDGGAAPAFSSKITLTGLNAGDQYLIQIGSWNDTSPVGAGVLNISQPPPPPANDTCATPDTTTLVGTGLFPFDNTSALTSAFDGGNTCVNPIPAGILSSDLFYTWTAPAAGDYTVNTLQSAFDTTLAVHVGNDCNATCLDFNDDANGTLQSELILTGVNAGDQFLVQVGAWNGGPGGAGILEIAPWVDPCAALLPDAFEPNDTCATPVSMGDGLYPGLTLDRVSQDFYAFTVPAGGTVNIVIDHLLADADIDGLLYDAAVVCHDTDQGLLDTLAAGYTTGDGENFSWDNLTGADVDCVLKVNIWPASTQGDCAPYDLTLTGTGASGPSVFCSPANVNSSGNFVTLGGSDFSGPGVVHLEAAGGPSGQFGYFLVSATALDPGVPVSQGLICVGAPQGRYNGVGGLSSVGQFDGAGVLQNLVGTSSVGSGFDVPVSLPNPPGGVITPGSTFHFQLWYRDGVNSNFSDALTVDFP